MVVVRMKKEKLDKRKSRTDRKLFFPVCPAVRVKVYFVLIFGGMM